MDKTNPDKESGLAKLMQDLGLADQEMNEEQFNNMAKLLNPQQEQALRARYGIPKPSRSVSKGNALSAETIREIERAALRKLRGQK